MQGKWAGSSASEPRAPSGVKQCSLVSSVETQGGGESRKRERRAEGSDRVVKVSDKNYVKRFVTDQPTLTKHF